MILQTNHILLELGNFYFELNKLQNVICLEIFTGFWFCLGYKRILKSTYKLYSGENISILFAQIVNMSML